MKIHSSIACVIKKFGVDKFIKEHWGKKALVIKGAFKKKDLMDLTEFQNLWKQKKDPLLDFKCFFPGKARWIGNFDFEEQDKNAYMTGDYEKMLNYVNAGAYVVGKPKPGKSIRMQEWVQDLDSILRSPSRNFDVNYLMTAHADIGIDLHNDPYEVFAVQCDGYRTWFFEELSAPMRRHITVGFGNLAYSNHDGHLGQAYNLNRVRKKIVSEKLKPGDFIYLPMYSLHKTINHGPSLGLSFLRNPMSPFEVIEFVLKDKFRTMPELLNTRGLHGISNENELRNYLIKITENLIKTCENIPENYFSKANRILSTVFVSSFDEMEPNQYEHRQKHKDFLKGKFRFSSQFSKSFCLGQNVQGKNILKLFINGDEFELPTEYLEFLRSSIGDPQLQFSIKNLVKENTSALCEAANSFKEMIAKGYIIQVREERIKISA